MSQLGKLIVVCGIDGSGKSTLEAGIAEALAEKGISVYCTKQPTDFYRQHPDIRKFLQTGQSDLSVDTIALVAAMDRMLHIEKEVLPRLRRGMWVICNRYVYSTYAYFECRGADMDFVRSMNRLVPAPDYGFLLKLPPEIAIERVRQRDGGKAKFEERDAKYLGKVQELLDQAMPNELCRLDATEPAGQLLMKAKSYLRL